MKQLAAFVPLTFLSFFTSAQCNSPVPSSATVIDTDGSYSIIGAQWVCGSVTATLSSPFVNAFIEGNANVTANTNLGVYSVRTNSTLTISGANNNIYYDPTATIIDNGTNTMLTECPDLTFDYTDAPANGCDPAMQVAPGPEQGTVLFPNPVHGILNIRALNAPVLGATLLDMCGRAVRNISITAGTLDLAGIEPGRYMMALRTATGVEARSVVVE